MHIMRASWSRTGLRQPPQVISNLGIRMNEMPHLTHRASQLGAPCRPHCCNKSDSPNNCWTGTFVDGERLEKSAMAPVVPGKSVITIGRCLNEYTLILEAAEHGAKKAGTPLKSYQQRRNSSLEAGESAHIQT